MRIRRIVTGAALVAGLSAASAVAGNPQAAADQLDCSFYLHFQGYSGKIVDMGCNFGTQGNLESCVSLLSIAGVPEDIGREGCRRAALP